MPLHLTKIAFGADSPESLARWLEAQAHTPGGEALLTTRNLPTRRAELEGGSLYWIHAHVLVGRSPLRGFVAAEGGRWHIRLEPRLIPVVPTPRRAHQGWRYLADADAPADAPANRPGTDTPEALPPALASELARLGLL